MTPQFTPEFFERYFDYKGAYGFNLHTGNMCWGLRPEFTLTGGEATCAENVGALDAIRLIPAGSHLNRGGTFNGRPSAITRYI